MYLHNGLYTLNVHYSLGNDIQLAYDYILSISRHPYYDTLLTVFIMSFNSICFKRSCLTVFIAL